MSLRPNDAVLLYNLACLFSRLGRLDDCRNVLRKAWDAGFHDASYARNDPDLAWLHSDPEFERLYPG